jgi:hypothetical protein
MERAIVKKYDISRRSALTGLGLRGLLTAAPGIGAPRGSSDLASLEKAIEASRMAMLAGDGRALAALLHDRLNYMHSSGHSQSKADVLRDLAGKNFFASLVYSGQTVDVVNDAGIVTLRVDQAKNLPNGGTRASQLKVLQVWVKAGSSWQMLARSSVLTCGGFGPVPCPK